MLLTRTGQYLMAKEDGASVLLERLVLVTLSAPARILYCTVLYYTVLYYIILFYPLIANDPRAPRPRHPLRPGACNTIYIILSMPSPPRRIYYIMYFIILYYHTILYYTSHYTMLCYAMLCYAILSHPLIAHAPQAPGHRRPLRRGAPLPCGSGWFACGRRRRRRRRRRRCSCCCQSTALLDHSMMHCTVLF